MGGRSSIACVTALRMCRTAWTLFVVERIIGRRCSLDYLDDHSALRTSSETLDLWAWTADPNLIPKVIWLTFTTRPSGGLQVFANVARPSGCKRGATFRVLVHLDMVEDHSNAPLDCYTSDGRAEAFSPPQAAAGVAHGVRRRCSAASWSHPCPP